MRRIYSFSALLILLLATSITQAEPPKWSGRNLIEEMVLVDGTNYVRMKTTSVENPANCHKAAFIDYQLDTGTRSPTEQQLMLDAFNMALIMSQPVEFLIDGDNCSTEGTSSSVRIAIGFRVYRQ